MTEKQNTRDLNRKVDSLEMPGYLACGLLVELDKLTKAAYREGERIVE